MINIHKRKLNVVSVTIPLEQYNQGFHRRSVSSYPRSCSLCTFQSQQSWCDLHNPALHCPILNLWKGGKNMSKTSWPDTHIHPLYCLQKILHDFNFRRKNVPKKTVRNLLADDFLKRSKYLHYRIRLLSSSKLLVLFLRQTLCETLVEVRKNLSYFFVGESLKHWACDNTITSLMLFQVISRFVGVNLL